jgi:hypothetical protein
MEAEGYPLAPFKDQLNEGFSESSSMSVSCVSSGNFLNKFAGAALRYHVSAESSGTSS